MNALSYSIEPFGENGWIATLSGDDMVTLALAANAAASALRNIKGVIDAVAGIDSLALRFLPADLSPDDAKAELETAIGGAKQLLETTAPALEIPVCYGGAYGPDFDALTKKLNISGEGLITLHSRETYRVLTVGFAPGFAYLGPLPAALRTKRLTTPRARVPAGSVGVAGAMTGVYAVSSPGGWPLIGRTPKRLFNRQDGDPFLFSPGAAVRFIPITEDDFKAMEAGGS